MSLLFEDLFKKANSDLKKEIDKLLGKKTSKAMENFDLTKIMKNEGISNGLINSLATGNWNLKRFKMERSGVT